MDSSVIILRLRIICLLSATYICVASLVLATYLHYQSVSIVYLSFIHLLSSQQAIDICYLSIIMYHKYPISMTYP